MLSLEFTLWVPFPDPYTIPSFPNSITSTLPLISASVTVTTPTITTQATICACQLDPEPEGSSFPQQSAGLQDPNPISLPT